MVVLLSGASAVSAWREASAPHVGDMIAFHPSGWTNAGKRLTVLTQAGKACLLELGTLRRSGGSFIIEGPASDGGFVVHWAGPRTSRGKDDCGASADVILDAQQLELLSVAALASPGRTREGV